MTGPDLADSCQISYKIVVHMLKKNLPLVQIYSIFINPQNILHLYHKICHFDQHLVNFTQFSEKPRRCTKVPKQTPIGESHPNPEHNNNKHNKKNM